MSEITDRIEELVEKRQRLWREGRPALKLSEQIEELYDQRRREQAAAEYGDAEEIQRRARVEREIEKLMSDDA